jgi:hypothetical protein
MPNNSPMKFNVPGKPKLAKIKINRKVEKIG